MKKILNGGLILMTSLFLLMSCGSISSSIIGDEKDSASYASSDSDLTSLGTKSYSMELKEQSAGWTLKHNSKYEADYYTISAVYCTNPTNHGNQSLALYVPQSYLNEDGSINYTNKVGKYTSMTAPIIYWNSHGSYIGMGPFGIVGNSTRSTQYGWAVNLIKNGCVVCMVGERGKTTTNEKGEVIGRGPIAISDLKAGVRFLRHNKNVIPGSTDRIVSVGTSSGGAMSALLGTSGNYKYYDSYLEKMGAVMDEKDDVFATQAYCPITDLDHADYAYEWMFNEDNSSLTDFEKALSSKCQKEYPKFINELDLKDEQGNSLTLNINGTKSGTYYEWLLNKYEAGFEDYVSNYETDYQGYSTEKGNGIDFLNNFDFITYDQQTKKAKMVTPKGFDSSLDALVKEYRPRQKNCPAFDSLVPQGTDNDVFGPLGPAAGTVDGARHFNTRLAEMIKELENEYPNEYSSYYQDYFTQSNEEEVKEWVKYLNPYSFLTSSLSSNVSPNFRINMGVHDADTSICISATLGLLLEKKGINTQFNILWDWGHNDCDTPTGLLNWVNSLS